MNKMQIKENLKYPCIAVFNDDDGRSVYLIINESTAWNLETTEEKEEIRQINIDIFDGRWEILPTGTKVIFEQGKLTKDDD